ncbi:MAG: Stp1/IreP family PP2C-type Ser/Thr phosphatase [Bacillota bacterium]|nr:Stp1/IreP family PP2C-type Ser/Thr phosphatase [Bacillota bacterium]
MVQIGFKSNRGIVRENNEDACFVIPGNDVYMVADGVGGNSSGEVASRTAVERIAGFVNENDIRECTSAESIFGFLGDAVAVANRDIYDMGRDTARYRGMATTVVIAYLFRGEAYIANVGDSRAYVYRSGEMSRITKDHTYVNELIDKGVITEDEAESHRQKNVITKALGAEPSIAPDYYKLPLHSGDVLMLCTDGLYGEVGEKRILEVLEQRKTMNETCSDLVEMAIQAGGRDNITVVCVRI